MTYTRQDAMALGADCDHCPLRVVGKFVPSEGPEHADIAFVGEAPGTQEAREGIPFTGPSGKLLQSVNNSYGLKRSEVFLTNACLCRPPDNATPAKSAVSACRPRLLNELSQRGASRVVALGNTAALSLLGVEGVTKLRVGLGHASPHESLAGARIIPTVHPAACLRQSDMFPSLVTDVGKVFVDDVTWTPPRYTVVDSVVDALEQLRIIEERQGDLVVDIECDIEKDTAYDHPDRYGLLCVGFGYEDDGEYTIVVVGESACGDESVQDAMDRAMAASRLVAQNGKFDLAGLYPVVGGHELAFDTMLASYALDERPGIHGLKQMAVENLGMPQYDEDIKKYVDGPTEPELEHYSGYGRIPRPILYKYNAYDIFATMGNKKVLKAKLDRTEIKPAWWDSTWHWEYKSLNNLMDHLVEASNALMYLELNGIAIDREYNRHLFDNYGESIGAIEDELNQVLLDDGWVKINPRSPQQVKKVLHEHFRINAPDTSKDTLELLMEQLQARYKDDAYERPEYKFAEILLKHRREAKMFGTYVKGIRKRLYKGRIYSTFSIHGTTTGRLASRNPNLQNIPRESAIKQQFVPAR